MDTARNELVNFIMRIPDSDIPTIGKILKAFLPEEPSTMTDAEYLQFLEQAPEDDEEPWTEDDERDIEEAKREIAKGNYITLEDFARKHGYGN